MASALATLRASRRGRRRARTAPRRLVRHHGQRHGRRHGEQHGELSERFWLSITATSSPARRCRRYVRQQHDADGDADDGRAAARRAVGVVEIGDGALLERGDHAADTMLIWVTPPAITAGNAERTRRRKPSVMRGRRRRSSMPLRPHAVDQQQQLQHAGCEDAPGLDQAGRAVVAVAQRQRQQHGRHQGQVEARSRRRSFSTNLPSELSTPDISATSDMHRRYGEGDLRHHDGQIELLGLAAKPGRQPVHQPRHGQHADGRQQQQHEHEAGPSPPRRTRARPTAPRLQPAGEQRH
jgi:hypothetical protein